MNRQSIVAILALLLLQSCAPGAKTTDKGRKDFTVTAYYAGGPEQVDSFATEKLTHIIHSFSHLQGARLHVDDARDSLTIQKLVALKKRNPQLKVLLSLGGWGGCETCSDVFSGEENRSLFAQSVKELTDYFGSDGIDLDWEYPALPSLPGHGYKPEDKQNFTLLVQELRRVLGPGKEISFAVGGFKRALDLSVEWGPVMQAADRVNLMSYDLAGGGKTNHHTPLYSTTGQPNSADSAIRNMISLGVPANKIVVGAAFYARRWDSIAPVQRGLYQPGKQTEPVAYKDLDVAVPEAEGYERHWDSTAHAPYIYNPRLQQFLTYDDPRSVEEKTRYVQEHGLNGIMFWQLAHDKYAGGLLDAIYERKTKGRNKQGKVKP